MKLFDRNVKVKIEASQNEQQATEFFYDSAGDRIRKTYHASHNEVLGKMDTDTYTQKVQYNYDAQGNLVELNSTP